MTDSIVKELKEIGELDIRVSEYSKNGFHLEIYSNPDILLDIVELLKREGFFLEDVTAIDWIEKDKIEIVYHLTKVDSLYRIIVKVSQPRANPMVPSISHIFPGALWHERETYEFFGIDFKGHPDLKNLILPEDAEFHPLRKDFSQ